MKYFVSRIQSAVSVGMPSRCWRQRLASVILVFLVGIISSCGHAPGGAKSPQSRHGQRAQEAIHPGGTLLWSDDFKGPDALQDWTVVQGGGGWGNNELQVYDRHNLTEASGGGLLITATRDGYGRQCWYGECKYSSGRLETKGLFAEEYGLFEARIKLPAGRGLWPAFWMEGADLDRVHSIKSGEIDVIEVGNRKPDLAEGFLHAPTRNYRAHLKLSRPLSAGYHIYGISWTPSGISWLLDGQTYGHVSAYNGWPFDQPFFLILNLAVGGTWPGPPDASTKLPAQMNISWIRVYKYA